ncbi:hypothetical protein AB6A40_007340 [Gnathostoma spinigerum]|uniref:Uncharacterized protein n=1 Tax=Gnathostoma spinigerum TaxID=75299 RepID=A0ABD6ELH5_9BILA
MIIDRFPSETWPFCPQSPIGANNSAALQSARLRTVVRTERCAVQSVAEGERAATRQANKKWSDQNPMKENL